MDRLAKEIAHVKEWSRSYLEGDRHWAQDFTKLLRTLLGATVASREAAGHINPVTVGNRARFTVRNNAPLRLNNGHFLSFYLVLESAPKTRPRVLHYTYNYHLGPELTGERWMFRYDFNRIPSDQHPPGHLHINAVSRHTEGLGQYTLERVHFYTGRVSLEAVIRVLIEQFGVPSTEEATFWRPLLAASEQEFLNIMHTPPSGPSA